MRRTFFRRPDRRPEHVPRFPVPGGRKPRLLQEDSSERIGGVVGDGIARGLASAHGGVKAREDVGEGGHRPMPSLNRAAASLAAAAMRSASAGSVIMAWRSGSSAKSRE